MRRSTWLLIATAVALIVATGPTIGSSMRADAGERPTSTTSGLAPVPAPPALACDVHLTAEATYLRGYAAIPNLREWMRQQAVAEADDIHDPITVADLANISRVDTFPSCGRLDGVADLVRLPGIRAVTLDPHDAGAASAVRAAGLVVNVASTPEPQLGALTP